MTQPAHTIPALSDLLGPDRIKMHLAAPRQDEALAELVDQIKEIAGQPAARSTLLHALIERENLHSTGIGDGVALPHARNALVGLVDHPILVFGRHEQGIPFAAIDGAPARLFFLIIAPTVTQHLAMLARLSRLLRDPKLRKDLLAAKTGDDVRSLIHDAEEKL
jgi:mannitol/fructose-specific phosphotransferase system IIA component (Ntr-type)